MDIRPLRELTDETFAALVRLIAQLSASAPPLRRDHLSRVIECPTNTVLLAWLDGNVVGSLTLVVFPLPTGVRAWIEDVVVDENARGHGAGTALTTAAIRIARSAGARSVDLTSRPARGAAHRLYERLGFELRDTDVYRLVPSTNSK